MCLLRLNPALQFTGIASQEFVRNDPWEKKKWELLPKSQYQAYAWGSFRVHDLPGGCTPEECSAGWDGFTTIQVGACTGCRSSSLAVCIRRHIVLMRYPVVLLVCLSFAYAASCSNDTVQSQCTWAGVCISHDHPIGTQARCVGSMTSLQPTKRGVLNCRLRLSYCAAAFCCRRHSC